MFLILSGCREITTKKECNYNIPIGYKLVYSESIKKYAITTSENYYLKDELIDLKIDIYLSYNEFSEKFSDSCKAKRYCHLYIIQQSDRDFK